MLALQNDHLNVNSKQEVFETLTTWLQGQAEPLSEDEQQKMFGYVRFTLLSQDFIDSTVITKPVFLHHVQACSHSSKIFSLVVQSLSNVFGRNKSKCVSVDQHLQIISWLNTDAATKLEVLYCASHDGWDGRDFHSKACVTTRAPL